VLRGNNRECDLDFEKVRFLIPARILDSVCAPEKIVRFPSVRAASEDPLDLSCVTSNRAAHLRPTVPVSLDGYVEVRDGALEKCTSRDPAGLASSRNT